MPYKDPEKQRKAQREQKARQREKSKETGVCCNCSKQAIFGHTRCQSCRDTHNAHHKLYGPKYKERLKEEGRCPSCTRPLLGEPRCPVCSNRQRDR